MKWKRQCADISECNTSNVRQGKKQRTHKKQKIKPKKRFINSKARRHHDLPKKMVSVVSLLFTKKHKLVLFFVRNFMIIE